MHNKKKRRKTMRKQEAEKLTENITREIIAKGLPMNIRNGSNEAAARYIAEIVKNCIEHDTPLGTISSSNDVYEFCPSCGAVIGSSAVYCKKCGSMIRAAV